MSTDDASLSEHEQKVFETIERSLLEEDPDFVRRLRDVTPKRDALRLLRLSIPGLVVGFVLMIGFVWNVALGAAGFVLMVASAFALAVSVRSLALAGRSPGNSLRDALKKAESRVRNRRPKG